ncbi:MAG: HupE/UreJ family protein [Saprospiraceae bacterium]|nr:HupE/UreJ family protein [Saprospiraceae bacterium]
MSEFWTYFQLGYDHILDMAGYDHMLFLVALVASYAYYHYKEILILVTAFTVGHCITLILAGKGWIDLDARVIEIGIATTIALTAGINLLARTGSRIYRYFITLIFGLIHGLGFSGFIRALIGRDEVLWRPLLYFNLGVEIGQILFVAILIVINYMAIRWLRVKLVWWTHMLSLIALVWSINMILERV